MAALLFSRARAIRFRQDNNEAVGGFFSQIGQLYMVHHLWGKSVFSAFISLNQPPTDCCLCPGDKAFTKGKGISLKAVGIVLFYIDSVDVFV